MTKQEFLGNVTIYVDTREKENRHITQALESIGVKWESRKLNLGDYSFAVTHNYAVLDFSSVVAIERKSGPGELYGNVMEKPLGNGQKCRFEKEVEAASRQLNQFTLLIEGVPSMEALRAYVVPEHAMKASPQRQQAEIGEPCYVRLRAWQQANRYNLRVDFVANKADTAKKIVEEFYYYFHNYKSAIAPRGGKNHD